jgi:hypothetical protein
VAHLCVATERAWALEQLAVIEREPGYRLVSCVVEQRAMLVSVAGAW